MPIWFAFPLALIKIVYGVSFLTNKIGQKFDSFIWLDFDFLLSVSVLQRTVASSERIFHFTRCKHISIHFFFFFSCSEVKWESSFVSGGTRFGWKGWRRRIDSKFWRKSEWKSSSNSSWAKTQICAQTQTKTFHERSDGQCLPFKIDKLCFINFCHLIYFVQSSTDSVLWFI